MKREHRAHGGGRIRAASANCRPPGARCRQGRRRTWQRSANLRKTKKGGHYLFNHKALAAVVRGKLLAALNAGGLAVPVCLPERWVVDCKSVGNGEKAVVYLRRYLYRGVIQERDILRCADDQVTFRYRDSGTGKNWEDR